MFLNDPKKIYFVNDEIKTKPAINQTHINIINCTKLLYQTVALNNQFKIMYFD